MVLIEMRESSMNKAFDLIDDAKESMKKSKMYLCALEECLEECFEGADDDEEIDHGMTNNIAIDELNYRRGMRDHESEMGMRGGMRRSMHNMRRRSGRYSY